jgi:hypothetical protein
VITPTITISTTVTTDPAAGSFPEALERLGRIPN